MALPPDAVFEAVLEDTSRADAPATRIGAVTIESPGNPPIAFGIPYDPSDIDETHTYAVRARILLGSSLLFTSDQVHRVLTGGYGDSVEIMLRRSGSPAGSGSAAQSPAPQAGLLTAPGLRLPATFRGDLPCADCPAIRYHLDLWPDQVFHLRQEYVGRDLATSRLGRWSADPSRGAIVLRSGADAPLQFEIKGADGLRLLDQAGWPIESTLPYELKSDGTLSPAELSLGLRGMMTYMADAARFTECLTGRSYPIAMEGAYLDLERAYRTGAKAPGTPLLVTFEGSIGPRPKMDGDGLEPTVSVSRFVSVSPGQSCETVTSDASLSNTYWRLVTLAGKAVTAPAPGGREPHLLLRQDGRYAATAGCNQLVGSYTSTDREIGLKQGVSTMMACPPGLAEAEKDLIAVLTRARQWRITGHALELTDDKGESLARLEAVYLR